jgi:IS30 family transposase
VPNLVGRSGIPFYFAHPYSPHERGTDENANKFLRRYVPKHRSIESISEFELHDINLKLNLRPMKSLDWKTPLELFMAG